MGMYDEIYGHIICPYCGQKTEVLEQIKVRDFPTLHRFKLGKSADNIKDGTYTWGSGLRQTLNDTCRHCGKLIYFQYTVEDETITAIDPIVDGVVKSEFGSHFIPAPKTKKLFVSLPMNGRDDDTIKLDMQNAKKEMEIELGQKLDLINSFIEEAPPKKIKSIPTWYLGKSLQKMAEADIAYFMDGYENNKGCQQEFQTALTYGIPIYEYSKDANKPEIENPLITLDLVNRLRARMHGVGLIGCKRALMYCDGDIDKAELYLYNEPPVKSI